jgi:hypothetical protein
MKPSFVGLDTHRDPTHWLDGERARTQVSSRVSAAKANPIVRAHNFVCIALAHLCAAAPAGARVSLGSSAFGVKLTRRDHRA